MQGQVKKRCEAKPSRLGHNLSPRHRRIEPHLEPLSRVRTAQGSQCPLPEDLSRNPPLTLR